jgi:hypothetical protein
MRRFRKTSIDYVTHVRTRRIFHAPMYCAVFDLLCILRVYDVYILMHASHRLSPQRRVVGGCADGAMVYSDRCAGHCVFTNIQTTSARTFFRLILGVFNHTNLFNELRWRDVVIHMQFKL